MAEETTSNVETTGFAKTRSDNRDYHNLDYLMVGCFFVYRNFPMFSVAMKQFTEKFSGSLKTLGHQLRFCVPKLQKLTQPSVSHILEKVHFCYF